MPTPQVRDYKALHQVSKRAADLAAYSALVASRPLAPPRRSYDSAGPVSAAELDAAKAERRTPRAALREA